MRYLMIISACLLISACATNPDSIAPTYVSSAEFDDMSCREVRRMKAQNDSHLQQLASDMRKKNNRTKVAAVVGTFLFWPAYFAMAGQDSSNDMNLANLKGMDQALTSAVEEKCYQNQVAGSPPPAQPSPRQALLANPDAVELPAAAYRCMAPMQLASIPSDADRDALVKAKNELNDYQARNTLYQECLADSLRAEGTTPGNHKAVVVAHNLSVTVEETYVDEFNAALDAYNQSLQLEYATSASGVGASSSAASN